MPRLGRIRGAAKKLTMNTIPIYVINLKKEKEKRSRMLELCRQHSLDCQFVDAVYGCDLADDYINQVYSKEESIRIYGQELTKNEIGCALSHMSIYERMINNNINRSIIFEDDICIDDDFKLVMNYLHRIPENFDIVLFGSQTDLELDREPYYSYWYGRKITEKYECVRLVQATYGTYGYLVSLQGAKKLVEKLSSITKPIDHYTGRDEYVNLYAISPRIVRHQHIQGGRAGIQKERMDMTTLYGNIPSKYYLLLKKIFKYFGVFEFIRNLRYFFYRIKPLRKYDA